MKMVELFSGCGGLAKGMEKAGFSHVALIEYNHQACESLRANFSPDIVHETDIRNVDFSRFGPVDAVAGGPPCQPFSLGGLAKANNDARDMFPQAARSLKELRPRGFVFENVKGLLRPGFSEYFRYIVLRLTYPDFLQLESETWTDHLARLESLVYEKYTGLKYRVFHKLLNAADYGVPQIRERVFIVGLRDDVTESWSWPPPDTDKKHWRSIASALHGLPDPHSESNSIPDHIYMPGAKSYPGHTGSDISGPSKTIKAGAHGVPGGENTMRMPDGSVRYFTVHEAKLIQTFPSEYKVTGPWGEAMRQIGNAVPVTLAAKVGRRLFDVLSRKQTRDAETFRYDNFGNLLLFEKEEKYGRTVRKGGEPNSKQISAVIPKRHSRKTKNPGAKR